MEYSTGADWSRTCEGCRHVGTEPWPMRESRKKTVIAYRCLAPGTNRGHVIGIGRFAPYIPAWCPENEKSAHDGTNIADARPKGQI